MDLQNETPGDDRNSAEGTPVAATDAVEEATPTGTGNGRAGEEEDFEKMLEAYDAKFKSLSEGAVVKGKVLKVLPNEVIVDVGYKSEGLIDIDEFTDRDGKVQVAAGDEIDVLLEKTEDREGYVVLSKEKAEKMKVWDQVEKAYETNAVITGRVIERIKGGLAVDIGVRAFLPGSLVDVRPVRNLDQLRGQSFRMRVIKVNKRRGNIVLSRKAVIEEENAEKKKDTLKKLKEGCVLRGVVKNLTGYGAFIDLGGIDGLLHLTDMSWGRLNHPSERFNIGDEADVIVLKFDPETERVSLGYKQLSKDPWERVGDSYQVGSQISGKVRNLTDFGAFVEVEEGIDGLVHISDMSWTKRIKHPSELVKKGDTIEAVILKIDSENQRLSLGMKQLQPDIWEEFFRLHRVGSLTEGTIVRLTDFGAFVELAEGIEGLVHVSELSHERIEDPSKHFQVGQEVRAKIIKLDVPEKKIGLSIKQVGDDEEQDQLSAYQEASRKAGGATLGDIADLGELAEAARAGAGGSEEESGSGDDATESEEEAKE